MFFLALLSVYFHVFLTVLPDWSLCIITYSLIFSERELKFTQVHVRYLSSSVRLSVVWLSSVCRLSVTFVHPTQTIEIFGNVSTPYGTLASADIQVKFYGDRPRGTPPSGELIRRGVAEYSDFGPIDGYISETVQDSRYVTINH